MTAVIFDLDGVVADTSEAHYRSWQLLADEEGVVFDRLANEALLGRTREQSLDRFLGARKLGEDERSDWLARKQRYFLAELDRMRPADALPGVRALLLEAREAHVPTALASSSRNARAVLDKLELTSLFRFVADGTSVAHPKPAPDIFLLAAAALEHAPGNCLVIEDSRAGVEAAMAAGCQVVGVGTAVRPPRHFATLAGIDLATLLGTTPA